MSETKPPSPRSSGLLLHPTSLPGPYGIGDLGGPAYHWINALARSRQKWWQILPLGPTGFGDSPYSCYSAFAGNPNLVSPDLLIEEGLLQRHQLQRLSFATQRVDYNAASDYKCWLLEQAWHAFQQGANPGLRADFDAFQEREASWLHDYSLFRAIKDAHDGRPWLEWPQELVERRPEALVQAVQQQRDRIGYHQLSQFLFFRQWDRLKRYANERGIRIIGDAPIFVSGDSADVWANPHFFLLDARRRPTFVAGVPPDYFSATGQLWGNPLYDWEALRQAGFRWWIDRVRGLLRQVDVVRLDHFRGFESYWEITAGAPTAQHGRWVKAPGEEMLRTLQAALGSVPIIAEDLGIITPEVDALRRRFQLPGMRVLHFAFGSGNDNLYLPHNYERETVVYTGTHDNDTTRGWYGQATDREKDHVRRYLGRDGSDIAWDMMRLAWSSIADYAIAPLQDLLNLGTEARMNYPGRAVGNWGWRFVEEQLMPGQLDRLAEMTDLYAR